MIVRDEIEKANAAARTVISNHDALFALASLPLSAPPGASAGQLLLVGLRNRSSNGSSGTSLLPEIKRIKRLSSNGLREAEKILDLAEVACEWLKDVANCLNSNKIWHPTPKEVPEHIAGHLRALKTYCVAGVVERAEITTALLEAYNKGRRQVHDAKHEFRRFRFTLAVAHCKQAAAYAEKWGRTAMAAGYLKRADKISKAYRQWAAAPRGAIAIRAGTPLSLVEE